MLVVVVVELEEAAKPACRGLIGFCRRFMELLSWHTVCKRDFDVVFGVERLSQFSHVVSVKKLGS